MRKRLESAVESTKPEVQISSSGGVTVRASEILGSEKAMRLIRATKRVYPKPSNAAGPPTGAGSEAPRQR